MTTDEKSEQGGYSWWAKSLFISGIIIIVLGFLLLRYFFLPFFILSSGEGTEYGFNCEEYEGGLKEEWLLSENITGYEDIPENQKTNLSNETIEALKSLGRRSFTSSNYSELTEEQKGNFKKVLKGERVIVNDRNATPPSHVFYGDQMYTCDTDRFIAE